jgi:hypothetical protein
VALKKPSDLFNKEQSSIVFQSSEISPNITETYDRFRDNLDKVNVLSEQIEYLSQQLSEKMTRTDLENAMLSNLMVLDENFKSIRNQVKGLNKEDLKEFKVNISNLTEIVGNLVETELPKYKKQITNNEVRISNQLSNFKEEIGERIQKFYEVLNEFNDVVQVIDTVSNIENYIQEHHQDLVNLREEVFCEIEKLPFGNLQENIQRLEKKIDFIKETYSKIEPEIIVKEVIKEGLLNEPPETKNSDPLTPLDQNFVTLDQLQNHYRLFINRIQQQLSTLGGSGETKLKYLDDIVGIATNASAYNGKFLKYNHSIGKFIFDDIAWLSTPAGTYTLSNVGIGTTNIRSALTVLGDVSVTGVLSTSELFVTSSGIFQSSTLIVSDESGEHGYIISGSATTDTYTVRFPTITSDTGIAVTGIAQTFSALQSFSSGINVTNGITATGLIIVNTTTNNFSVENQTTGTISLGSTVQTGRILVGRSSTNQTLNLATGLSGVGTTKTINLGTNGLSGSFTQINIGPTAGVGTITINSGTNVGIGTTIPVSKLEVQGGDIKVGVNTSQGLILTSPNGTKYRLIVNDAGALSTVSLP